MNPSGSGLNPQAYPPENQANSTPAMSVGREAPHILQNLAGITDMAGRSSPITPSALLPGCSSMPTLSATQEGSSPRAAALVGSMASVDEQRGAPSLRPPCGFPAARTQVPISIVVFHRRLTGRGSRPQLPPQSHTPVPVHASSPGVTEANLEGGVDVQQNFLSLGVGGASKVDAGGVALDPSELGTPDRHSSEHGHVDFQPNGLCADASETGNGREPSQLQQSATTFIFDRHGRLEPVVTANTGEIQGQHTQESTSQVAEGSADGNINMRHRVRKRSKMQVDHSDKTAFPTPAVCKERTLNQIEIQILDADRTEALTSEETPAKKPKTRRKKHRAKVIRENKPAKTKKPTVTTPSEKSQDQKVKRSYVRKKRNLSSLEKGSEPVGDQTISRETGVTARGNMEAVRRRLQFEFKEEKGAQGAQSSTANSWQQNKKKPIDAQSSLCSVTKSSVQIEHALQVDMENSPGGLAFGLTCKLNKLLDEYIHLPEAAPNPAQEVSPATSGCTSMEVERKQDDVGRTHYPDSTSKSGLCTAERRGLTTMEVNKKDLDLNYSNTGVFQMHCSASSLLEIDSTKSQMTKVSKMEKNHVQNYNGESSLVCTRNSIIMRTAAEMLAFYQAGGIKKKRSARVRKNSFLSVMDLKKNTSQELTRLPQSCMEAMYESSYIKFMTKKRSQKTRLNSPISIQPDVEQKDVFSFGGIFYGGFNESKRSAENFQQTMPKTPENKWINPDIRHEVSEGSSGKTSTVPYMDYLRGVASKLKYLDLNKEMHLSQTMSSVASLGAINGLSNALVPYGGGVLAPYQTQLHLVKKQRPRAKVDLDFETTRVWNLLMGKAAEPVDGTDVEKERWWQQEREVFQGRANSFIARMRLVQGDRQFSPWKGSVVDSVVGVFLTQNVADHLSSSAYMALAATFPPVSFRSNCSDDTTDQDNEEIISTSAVEENNMSDIFNNSLIPDLEVNCAELSMDYAKTLTEPKDSTTANELFNCESYSLYYKEPAGSFCDHQAGVNHKEKQFPDFCTVESRANMNIPHETQFPKEISSSQSVVTSESILEPGLALRSGMDHAPTNFVGGISAAAFKQTGNNFDGGKSFEGNDATANETESQGTKPAAINSDIVGEPGIPSDSIMSPLFSAIDCSQLDVRNCTHVSSTSPTSSIGSASPNFPIGAIDENFSLFMPFDTHSAERNGNMTVDTTLSSLQTSTELTDRLLYYDKRTSSEAPDMKEHESLYATGGTIPETAQTADGSTLKYGFTSYNGVPDTAAQAPKPKKPRTTSKKNTENLDWDKLRRQAFSDGHVKERSFRRRDSVDWEAVRCADVHRISHAIRERGMNNVLAERIQKFLNRLVSDHGSIDLEWLRDVPPDSAKDYLLSIRGLGLKSTECVRLLTLHHLAFPVDTNVGRICVRLGWVPIQPLPESLQLHLLELYPVLETIQKYLWPRLCKLDQQTLYELHYQMITFGKVFCTKSKPNCNACPMRSECKHFASAFASARLALPSPQDKRLVKLSNQYTCQNGTMPTPNSTLPRLEGIIHAKNLVPYNAEPIIEEPASPKEEECQETLENDIEDFDEDNGEIPTIKLNMEAFAQNLENCIKESNTGLQSDDIAKAMVAISTEAASIPVPKLKNVHRLRTEHYVYELPDSHPLVQQLELDQREPDDPSPYLLAIWMPDELKQMSEAPKPCCDSQMEGGLRSNEMCHNCVYEREKQSRYVRGTILVPCRTAMRGSFPLNGTYFQVNEVFADHKSSYNPIHVAREQLWSLHRRMVYFGTSVPTIFKGLRTEEIQQCFWRGFVCVRGIDMETRAPRPLCPHFHLAASKLRRPQKKAATEQTV